MTEAPQRPARIALARSMLGRAAPRRVRASPRFRRRRRDDHLDVEVPSEQRRETEHSHRCAGRGASDSREHRRKLPTGRPDRPVMNRTLELLLSRLYDGALAPEHRADLEKSALTDETIRSALIRSVPPEMIPKLLGFDVAAVRSALLFPFRLPDGGFMDHVRFKIFPPTVDAKGDTLKYLQPKGTAPHLYFAPATMRAVLEGEAPLWLVEGEKKALAVAQSTYLQWASVASRAGIAHEPWISCPTSTRSPSAAGSSSSYPTATGGRTPPSRAAFAVSGRGAPGTGCAATAGRAAGSASCVSATVGGKVGADDFIRATGASAGDLDALPRADITARENRIDAGDHDLHGSRPPRGWPSGATTIRLASSGAAARWFGSTAPRTADSW